MRDEKLLEENRNLPAILYSELATSTAGRKGQSRSPVSVRGHGAGSCWGGVLVPLVGGRGGKKVVELLKNMRYVLGLVTSRVTCYTFWSNFTGNQLNVNHSPLLLYIISSGRGEGFLFATFSLRGRGPGKPLAKTQLI